MDRGHIEYAPRVPPGAHTLSHTGTWPRRIAAAHELTRPDKENDRVRNIATLNAQTGPVLLAYRANDALRELLASPRTPHRCSR